MNSSKYINVPISLVRRFKGNKTSLEAVACAILIKTRHTNSTLYQFDDYKKVVECFGVSYRKAKKIMATLQYNELFVYNEEKNCIFAKSFKDKTKKRYGKRRKYDACSDYCFKVEVIEGMTLRMMIKQLRRILALCVIHVNGMNTCKSVENTDTLGKEQEGTRAIPQRKIADAIGLSRSSASRYVKEMVNEQIVSKTMTVAECVIPELNDETDRLYREKHPNSRFVAFHNETYGGWSGWVFVGCEYSIIRRDISDRFKNVIYNFWHKSMKKNVRLSCELDGGTWWNKFN